MSRLFPDGSTTTLVNCRSDALVDDAQPFSIAAKVYARGPGVSNAGIVLSKADNNTGDWRFGIGGSTRPLVFNKDTDGVSLNVVSTDVIPLNRWVDVGMTWDGGLLAAGVKQYIDAIEVAYTTQTDGTGNLLTDASRTLRIGNTTGTNRGWNGYIAHLSFYSGILTQDQFRILKAHPGKYSLGSRLLMYVPLLNHGWTEPAFSGNKIPVNIAVATGNCLPSTFNPPVLGIEPEIESPSFIYQGPAPTLRNRRFVLGKAPAAAAGGQPPRSMHQFRQRRLAA